MIKRSALIALLLGLSTYASAEQNQGVVVGGLLVDKQLKFNENGDMIDVHLDDEDIAAVQKCESTYLSHGHSYPEISFVQECLNQIGHPKVLVVARVAEPAQVRGETRPPQRATDLAMRNELAKHLLIFKFSGFTPSGTPKPRTPIDAAELAVAQTCKDAVADGQKFAPSDQDEPPLAPPGMINPALEQKALLVNRCLQQTKGNLLFVVGSDLPVEKPLLK